MKTAASLSLFLLTVTIPASLLADAPLPPPAQKEVWSPNKQFCAVMEPKPATTTIYRVASDGQRTKSWTMPGWFRVAHLADDGEHLVVGHGGINLLPLKVTKDEPMIRFYKQGSLINTVTLGELLKDQSSLKRTASHYLWGSYLGLDKNGHYAVETVEGRKLVFDVTTGKSVAPVQDAAEKQPAVPAERDQKEVYIPNDLDDCFAELNKILSKEQIEKMKNGPEKDMILYHHGLGTWLRNNWGLWKGSRLSKWFNEKGIRHPDDMSGIIFDSFWRHLNGKPINLDEQVKHYQDYWKRVEEEQKVPKPK